MIVEAGNTLSGIAGQHGLTVDQLLTANPTIEDSDTIYIGQEIAIPNQIIAAPPEKENEMITTSFIDKLVELLQQISISSVACLSSPCPKSTEPVVEENVESTQETSIVSVQLPEDRTKPGTMSFQLNGRSYNFEVLGKADNGKAIEEGNGSRSPLLPYGDTPTGRWALDLNGTRSKTSTYGPNEVVRMSPISGDAVTSYEQGNRSGILIHGGDIGSADQLRPTYGCLRLSNEDQDVLTREMEEHYINGGDPIFLDLNDS